MPLKNLPRLNSTLLTTVYCLLSTGICCNVVPVVPQKTPLRRLKSNIFSWQHIHTSRQHLFPLPSPDALSQNKGFQPLASAPPQKKRPPDFSGDLFHAFQFTIRISLFAIRNLHFTIRKSTISDPRSTIHYASVNSPSTTSPSSSGE